MSLEVNKYDLALTPKGLSMPLSSWQKDFGNHLKKSSEVHIGNFWQNRS
jgi:hypothetical protein